MTNNEKEIRRRDIEQDIMTAIRQGNDRMVEHLEEELEKLEEDK